MTSEKTDQEQMIDTILGANAEMTDELAAATLSFYGITENDLIDSFKSSISKRLNHLPLDSEEAKRLAGVLRNMQDFQKGISGEKLSPKERISQLFGGLFTPPVSATYSFREKKEGELPDSDQQILDDLKKELLDKERE
jgi:hypothetical protein